MKIKISILFFLVLFWGNSFAQSRKTDDDERVEKREAKSARIKDKTDYNLFHRQMLSLKEYNDERKKIPSLQKANKMTVKVIAVVDTSEGGSDDEGSNKMLTGYIKQEMGENSNNVYEVTFDRTLKKIVSVKRTGEGEEVEKDEDAAEKKPAKKPIHKKNKDDDDDEDND